MMARVGIKQNSKIGKDFLSKRVVVICTMTAMAAFLKVLKSPARM